MGRHCWSNRQIIEDCKTYSAIDPNTKDKLRGSLPGTCFDLSLIENGVLVNKQELYIRRSQVFRKPWYRYWLSCPKCHRTVLKLYWPTGANYYACRICHDLTYRSQKRRNGWQEKFLMNFGIPCSRRDAWQWLDYLHGRK